jgi:hypothetical protein
VDLDYFKDERGFTKPLAPMPGEGPTWITSLIVLPDKDKRERLIASYIKVKPPMTVYARGLAIFNDAKNVFVPLCDFDFKAPCYPNGHMFLHRDDGVEYVYFCHPFPLTRVRATMEDVRKPESYECYTCLKDKDTVDRDTSGKVRYAWRKNVPAVGPMEQGKLVAQKKLKEHEGLLQLRDRDSGKRVIAHAGSVYWNAHRRKWVMIANQWGGSSFLGEVWYAEAPTLTGPWAYAVKVATHPKYSYYNPKQHPMFDELDGRVIYFEGTYSHTFSGNPDQTPRYDYNQLMYRLDLTDTRLALPVAIGENGAYYALERSQKGTIPVVVEGKTYYALPLASKVEGTKVWTHDNKPIGRVWPNPWHE